MLMLMLMLLLLSMSGLALLVVTRSGGLQSAGAGVDEGVKVLEERVCHALEEGQLHVRGHETYAGETRGSQLQLTTRTCCATTQRAGMRGAIIITVVAAVTAVTATTVAIAIAAAVGGCGCQRSRTAKRRVGGQGWG